MRNYKISYILLMTIIMVQVGCKKQLDVVNPNQATLENAKTEAGVISLAIGSVYNNGFNQVDIATLNVLGDSYFALCYGYHELMADVVSAEAANQSINVVNLPDYVIYDNGVKQSNTSSSRSVFRIANSRDNRSNNPSYFEWAYMYTLNNACNNLLDIAEGVSFSGDAATRKNTIKAWAYWWKGYAYSRIGSLYYSGLISNTTGGKVSLYQVHDDIIAEANKNFDQAAAILNAITSAGDYTAVLSQLIPGFCQAGKGGVLTPAMWVRNINTMKARNFLVNKRAKTMTNADWTSLLALTNTGIQSTDFVFTGRTTGINGFFSSGAGSVAILTTGDPSGSTFKISERLIQEYKPADKRRSNNFTQLAAPYINQVGGFTFSNRFELLDGGNGNGAATLTNSTPGQYELFIAGSYEENELMKAEANIRLGNINPGLTSVDLVRTYQGASLPVVSGTGLTMAQALEELRRERRVALIFRALSFYDARRWGVIDDISKGGGRTGAVVLSSTGVLNISATINYNFLDYWDVPDDESALNPPATGSAPVKNPN
ncbi:MAG: RagB/SusD family nutrient uptake outer membrane protein [Bacteroidota bacterium]